MKRRNLCIALAAVVLALWAGTGAAHDKKPHAKPAATQPLPAALRAKSGAGPFDKIGGSFSLIGHDGKTRSDTDFRGRFMLIFFGYANCQSICPVGLSRMAAALDMLDEKDRSRVQPLLITVDPKNDTPEALAQAMPKIHPRLIGLTGSDAQLHAAYRAYQIESKQVSKTADGKPIFAHGSFIYLMRPDGGFATLMLPVMGEEQMAKILRRYVS